MAIKNYNGEKRTPNQFAKEVIVDFAERATEFWGETMLAENVDSMTPRELEQVEAAIEKQAQRVYRLLGGYG
jgi:hypothetical protein